jgi:hypothetical protein
VRDEGWRREVSESRESCEASVCLSGWLTRTEGLTCLGCRLKLPLLAAPPSAPPSCKSGAVGDVSPTSSLLLCQKPRVGAAVGESILVRNDPNANFLDGSAEKSPGLTSPPPPPMFGNCSSRRRRGRLLPHTPAVHLKAVLLYRLTQAYGTAALGATSHLRCSPSTTSASCAASAASRAAHDDVTDCSGSVVAVAARDASAPSAAPSPCPSHCSCRWPSLWLALPAASCKTRRLSVIVAHPRAMSYGG